MEEKISKNNVEVMVVSAETKQVRRKTVEEVAAILSQIK
jgi:hypothetical protein